MGPAGGLQASWRFQELSRWLAGQRTPFPSNSQDAAEMPWPPPGYTPRQSPAPSGPGKLRGWPPCMDGFPIKVARRRKAPCLLRGGSPPISPRTAFLVSVSERLPRGGGRVSLLGRGGRAAVFSPFANHEVGERRPRIVA